MGKLGGKVAVITGAASGIGRASALLFAKEGAHVVAADIDVEGGKETEALVGKEGGNAIFVRTNVTLESDVKNLIQETVTRFGRLDILFNNAGIVLVKFLEDTTNEEWERVIGINLKSIFFSVKYSIPIMKQQNKGVIINTSSVSGIVGQPVTPIYSASKGAVVLLTKSLAVDYARYGIRVNCICPGMVDTPMIRRHIATMEDPEGFRKDRENRHPIGRFIKPEEVAQAALYLASDDSSAITGTALLVDGGLLATY
jgi:NAD(P)-dependent dehydrogenase (short-subunit alcohol dehydrogenase family)